MELNYCRRCGAKLKSIDGEEYRCSNGHSMYHTPTAAANLILVDVDRNIYLARRSRDPGKGLLDTLGGFKNVGETAEEAVYREVEEETGLTRDAYGPLRPMRTSVHAYPFQGEIKPIVSINYIAKLHDKSVVMTPNDDVASIEKIPIDELDFSQMHSSGPDNQARVERLRNHIDAVLED